MNLIKYNLCLLMLTGTYGRPSVSQFRVDYTYSTNTNAYYKFHEEVTNWQDAVAKCRSEGAQLFYPANKAEASEIVNLLDPWAHRDNIWIGVSDLRSNEVYETVDGRPLDEVHNQWDVDWHQPDKSFHCVIMWTFHSELWLKPCTEEYSFICNYAPGSSDDGNTETSTVPIETTHVNVVSKNLDGRPSVSQFRVDYTYSTNTNAYYKFHEEVTNWQHAIAKCRSEGAQLFYPANKAEASEISNLLDPWAHRDNIWIGVSDLRLNEVYETVDGRPLDEVHNQWDVDWHQPDKSYHCVIMWKFHLELWLKPCSEEYSFICKYTPDSSERVDIGLTTPIQLEITESSTVPIETTTPVIVETTPFGLEIPVLPTEVVDDQPSHVHFGNLVGQELKRFTPKEKLQIMVSILEVIQSYDVQAPTQYAQQTDGSQQLEPRDSFQ